MREGVVGRLEGTVVRVGTGVGRERPIRPLRL
jgi:hypothetical protein